MQHGARRKAPGQGDKAGGLTVLTAAELKAIRDNVRRGGREEPQRAHPGSQVDLRPAQAMMSKARAPDASQAELVGNMTTAEHEEIQARSGAVTPRPTRSGRTRPAARVVYLCQRRAGVRAVRFAGLRSTVNSCILLKSHWPLFSRKNHPPYAAAARPASEGSRAAPGSRRGSASGGERCSHQSRAAPSAPVYCIVYNFNHL